MLDTWGQMSCYFTGLWIKGGVVTQEILPHPDLLHVEITGFEPGVLIGYYFGYFGKWGIFYMWAGYVS